VKQEITCREWRRSKSQLENTSSGRVTPLPVSSTTPAPKPKVERSPVAASRVGKVHIGAYLNPDFKRGLRMVQAVTGEDIQGLLARALNDLFRAHNVPVVDQN
jgi:hypothetical protein